MIFSSVITSPSSSSSATPKEAIKSKDEVKSPKPAPLPLCPVPTETHPHRISPTKITQATATELAEWHTLHQKGNTEWRAENRNRLHMETAIKYWSDAIAVAPINVEAAASYSNRSQACLDLNHVEWAEEDARATIKLRPQWAKGYLRLIYCHLRNCSQVCQMPNTFIDHMFIFLGNK